MNKLVLGVLIEAHSRSVKADAAERDRVANAREHLRFAEERQAHAHHSRQALVEVLRSELPLISTSDLGTARYDLDSGEWVLFNERGPDAG